MRWPDRRALLCLRHPGCLCHMVFHDWRNTTLRKKTKTKKKTCCWWGVDVKEWPRGPREALEAVVSIWSQGSESLTHMMRSLWFFFFTLCVVSIQGCFCCHIVMFELLLLLMERGKSKVNFITCFNCAWDGVCVFLSVWFLCHFISCHFIDLHELSLQTSDFLWGQ